jgi:hypothetical protein
VNVWLGADSEFERKLAWVHQFVAEAIELIRSVPAVSPLSGERSSPQ